VEPVGPGLLGLGYRPYLDGLRAVAVYLVVLFHAGADRFSGGFVGVDVFFVLSGFLVTRLLLRDLVGGGRIRLSRFYARRFRRLLPAAFVTLIVTALVYTAVASPVEVLDAVGGFKAAFLYVTNWYFIAQAAGYFGADVSNNPVLHFWSLAVEEQFYLLWPLLLGGLFVAVRRFGARQYRALQIIIATAAATSLAWAWVLRTTNPDRAYYGTDARAYQLLAGALLALTPGLIARAARHPKATRITAAAALAVLVITATSIIDLDAIQRGTLIAAITVTLIAALEATHTGPTTRLLSRDTIVYLGRISYGTYLWHWPVILLLTRVYQPPTLALIALTVLIATGLASLSYQLLEQPIRISALLDRHRRAVIAVGLATSITAALLIIPAITKPTTNTTATAANLTTTGFTPVPKDLDFAKLRVDYPPLPNCLDKPPEACTLVHGTGAHVLIIGDSHAAMLIPTLTAIAQTENLTLSVDVLGVCPWQRNLYVVQYQAEGEEAHSQGCGQFKNDMYDRVIPALNPDIIITMNRSYELPNQPVAYIGDDHAPLTNGSPAYNELLERTTRDSVAQLRAGNRRVVLVEPIPYRWKPGFDPVTCLSSAVVVESCTYVVDPGKTGLENLYQRIDTEDDHVWALDLDKLVCPYLPICDPIVNHQVVKFDLSHLTAGFANSLAPDVDAFLKQNSVLAVAPR
jgi:peptidoglycan/LPS O-acetylase OafA/YrhL